MIQTDVPSPIDLRNIADAREWERTAMQRPFREDFFAAFTHELEATHKPDMNILELGSGPGFLAQYALSRIGGVNYTLLDFSAAMHELAQKRLNGITGSHVLYLERNFKEKDWTEGLGQFDVVASNQSVHELRHKRYAPGFFLQVRKLLKADGALLICDHYCGDDGMTNDQLYMSRSEQRQALEFADFAVSEILVRGGRALYKALPNQ